MTRKEAERQNHQAETLMRLGLSRDEAEQLRRISRTLSSWGERECNEDIETDEQGRAWLTIHGAFHGHRYRIPNREAGALRRLAAILKPHSRRLTYYHQTDPRGAALYIIPRKRIRLYAQMHGGKCDLSSNYNLLGYSVW